MTLFLNCPKKLDNFPSVDQNDHQKIEYSDQDINIIATQKQTKNLAILHDDIKKRINLIEEQIKQNIKTDTIIFFDCDGVDICSEYEVMFNNLQFFHNAFPGYTFDYISFGGGFKGPPGIVITITRKDSGSSENEFRSQEIKNTINKIINKKKYKESFDQKLIICLLCIIASCFIIWLINNVFKYF